MKPGRGGAGNVETVGKNSVAGGNSFPGGNSAAGGNRATGGNSVAGGDRISASDMGGISGALSGLSSQMNKGLSKDQSGLNPNRIRGFGDVSGGKRIATPSLNEMRVKQGAIVSKFMTFF